MISKLETSWVNDAILSVDQPTEFRYDRAGFRLDGGEQWSSSIHKNCLGPGDTLALYTDGVRESPNAAAKNSAMSGCWSLCGAMAL
jgi:serine phosphatase RsbU (regulator of sigma subunit)